MSDHQSPSGPHSDVRMRGFSRRTTVEAALAWIDAQTPVPLESEELAPQDGAGRVLAAEVISRFDVPGFDRSMMDGYAVRAADTSGADAYQRLRFQLIGRSLPGRPFEGVIGVQQAVRIMTGAPLPAGADAVLPAEQGQAEDDVLFAVQEVTPGKHIGRRGEDIAAGSSVLPAGRTLRPQDIGLLVSIGTASIPVVRRCRVRILITGDELLPAGSTPGGSCIVDSNGPMLQALVARDGGQALTGPILADDPAEIRRAMQTECDVLLISGGSSVGEEDHAPRLVAELGELAIHGMAMRPSSPAGMGRIGRTLVFLLPGNPVSCLCAYDFFAGRAIRRWAGRGAAPPYRVVALPLARKLVSQVGRVDYARVKIREGNVEPISVSGASLLRTTTDADGFVIIPADSEGYAAGATVEVYRYDR